MNISGEGTALPNWSPLVRRLHNPNLDRTPVYLLRETGGLVSTAALHIASVTILFHRWTPQLCTVPLWRSLEMSVLLPAATKDDLLSGGFVCRHKAGRWNAVSAD